MPTTMGDEDDDDKFKRMMTKVEKKKKKDLLKKDPFVQYGTGIRNYFMLQVRLIYIFAILSVFAIIQMIVNSSFGGLDHLGDIVSFHA